MKSKPTYQELQKENEILRQKLLSNKNEKIEYTPEQNKDNLFKSIFELHNAVMLLIEPKTGLIVNANKAAENYYGYNKALITSMQIQDINTLSSNEVEKERINASKHKRNYFIFKHRIASSEIRTVEVHSCPIKYQGENILFSIIHDITEKVNTEQALIESETKYRLLIDTMKDVIVKISTTGELLYVSPSVGKFGGYKPEEEVGNDISKYFAEKNDYLQSVKLIQEVVETHKSGNFEFLFKPKNEVPFPVEHTFVPLISNNKVYAIQMVLRDISERKKAELELLKSEKRYNKDERIAKIGNWEYNIQTGKLWGSIEAKKIFGFNNTISEFTLEEIEKCIPESEKVNKALLDLINFEKAYKLEYEIISKDKQEHKTIWSIAEIEKDNAGNNIGIAGVIQDITERKKTEYLLKEANDTKDKFFNIIAHDLRSPFNSMLGFSKMLDDKFEKYDTEKKKKFINIINQGLQGTYKLLENLLTWSRSQRGTIDFNPEKLNLHLLAEETSGLLHQSTESKSINLKNKIADNIYVNADKDMLSTIIRNLISNAIKFTQKGGDISIDAKSKQQFIEITVKDNGIGIPKEIQSKLFDIGENTSTQGTENESGTGLGLILCKEFVEKHGGKIWVESEVGKGSDFKFTIPLSIE